MILLNKTDLVSKEELDNVASTVASINSTLRVHHTVKGNVPLAELFDLRAFTSPAIAALEPSCGCSSADHNHTHAHATGPNAVSTITVPLPILSTAQFDKLNAFLESLLWHRTLPSGGDAPDILRTKGYALLDDGSARVIQGVWDLFEIRNLDPNANDEKAPSPKVVFIGRGVDDKLVQAVKVYIGV